MKFTWKLHVQGRKREMSKRMKKFNWVWLWISDEEKERERKTKEKKRKRRNGWKFVVALKSRSRSESFEITPDLGNRRSGAVNFDKSATFIFRGETNSTCVTFLSSFFIFFFSFSLSLFPLDLYLTFHATDFSVLIDCTKAALVYSLPSRMEWLALRRLNKKREDPTMIGYKERNNSFSSFPPPLSLSLFFQQIRSSLFD